MAAVRMDWLGRSRAMKSIIVSALIHFHMVYASEVLSLGGVTKPPTPPTLASPPPLPAKLRPVHTYTAEGRIDSTTVFTTSQFVAALASNASTIRLAASRYVITTTLMVLRSVTITAAVVGAKVVLDGASEWQVMRIIISGGAVELIGLSFVNGHGKGRFAGGGICIDGDVDLSFCAFYNNLAFDSGGGVYVNSGRVTFFHCSIRDNESVGGWDGGGLAVYGGTVELANCIVRDNLARYGPNVYIGGGKVCTWQTAITEVYGSLLACVQPPPSPPQPPLFPPPSPPPPAPPSLPPPPFPGFARWEVYIERPVYPETPEQRRAYSQWRLSPGNCPISAACSCSYFSGDMRPCEANAI